MATVSHRSRLEAYAGVPPPLPMCQAAEVRAWLADNGLAAYADTLLENELDTLEVRPACQGAKCAAKRPPAAAPPTAPPTADMRGHR